MKVLPISNGYCYAQKKEQNPTFKTKFVNNDTLKKTVAHAEKQHCRAFLFAAKSLVNDKLNRTLEITGGVYASKDGILFTKTKLICDDIENEIAGFPHIYGTTCDEMIANDGRLLLVNFTNAFRFNSVNDYLKMSQDEISKEYKELKKQLFK